MEPSVVIFFIVILWLLCRPSKRSRRVSPRTKRQVIAKWEARTGKTYNRYHHEIDHKRPWSWGGDSSEDNLQVLTRKANRSKGARWTN